MKHDPELWRARFPILETTTYLVNHSLGAMPATVYERLRAFADQWAERGVRAWAEGWWTSPIDVGNVLGRILNAPPGSVVMHQNVSVIQALVASCLDFSGVRNKVVYTDQEFPSNMYVWEGMRARGAKIEVVPTTGVEVDLQRLLAAIDETTLIVPLSLVCYKTNFLVDAKAVCARAKEVGALVMLDAYQALGTVPVDVRALGVDMVCGGSVKWLCGGPGAAYLYVRPDLLPKLEPRITGWAAHEEPFAFETGPQRYAHDIRRMLHGTPAVASFLAATAGYEVVLEAGVGAIREHSIALTEGLRKKLIGAGFQVNSPADPARRGSTLTVGLKPDENGPAFVRAFEEMGILVDHRPGAGIRVSPHFYTLEDELDEFVEALVELRTKKRWQGAAVSTAKY
jgi:kynureninase